MYVGHSVLFAVRLIAIHILYSLLKLLLHLLLTDTLIQSPLSESNYSNIAIENGETFTMNYQSNYHVPLSFMVNIWPFISIDQQITMFIRVPS